MGPENILVFRYERSVLFNSLYIQQAFLEDLVPV